MNRSWPRALIVILACALLIRVTVAIMLGDQAEPISGAFDQVSYDLLARRLLQGYGFSFPIQWYPFTPPNEPTSHWSFLYTLYLAGVYALFGPHPLAARLIQAGLSIATCGLLFHIGRRLYGERVGLAAAALAAVYAYLIFFNAALMTQTFYIICLLISIALAIGIVHARRSDAAGHGPSFQQWAALGVALGVGTLFRQTLLLFGVLLFAWIWLDSLLGAAGADRKDMLRPGHGVSWPLRGTVLAGLIIATLILPWTVRNYVAYHDFLLLNSNSGFWFFSSNHPNQGTSFNGSYVAPIPDDLQGLKEPAIDRALLARALGFIWSDPTRFVLLSLNRAKDYFWMLPSEDSSLLSNVARLGSFTLYAPFMLYGLVLSRRHWRDALPLYLYVAFECILCLVSWSGPRYRLPSDVLMMIMAGVAVVDLVDRVNLPARFRRLADSRFVP